jgi:hypothetical protein
MIYWFVLHTEYIHRLRYEVKTLWKKRQVASK